jgi:glycine cleavage system aminomethyltransferase T
VETVYADRVGARGFLAQSEAFVEDASLSGLGSESRSVLLHNAAIAACDAILQAVGQRVTSGDRSHMLRLETALGHLDRDTEDLLERLDASRERRNEASYAAGFVAQASIDDASEVVAELIQLVRQFVSA